VCGGAVWGVMVLMTFVTIVPGFPFLKTTVI
jgi:hypothetical protein